jgi:glycosyltransferase involved in cell wall biosynthesis
MLGGAQSPKNEAHTSPPLVSIGMPVYNEERFIAESLNSLLAQDYPSAEIIVSDNASTDGTGDICREFAAKNERVQYHRFEYNRGATENFKKVLAVARGKYFMWTSGHDLWAPDLISECVRLLEAEPEAVIAFASAAWIDVMGNKIMRTSGWTDTRGLDPVARFFSVFWGNMHPILGVIRTDALRKVRMLSCAGTDLVMLSELVMMGHFVHARLTSWSRREPRPAETHQERMKRYRSAQYGLSRSLLDRVFPVLRLPIELVKAVWRAPLGWFDKAAIFVILFPALPIKYVVGRRGRSVP